MRGFLFSGVSAIINSTVAKPRATLCLVFKRVSFDLWTDFGWWAERIVRGSIMMQVVNGVTGSCTIRHMGEWLLCVFGGIAPLGISRMSISCRWEIGWARGD